MDRDLELLARLPAETWQRVIHFLPRISRQNLSFLHGFEELVEDTTQLEDRRLYQALKNGNLRWSKITGKTMQPRLRHGTTNFHDQLIIFGGSSGYQHSSGTYNDVWMFDYEGFHRISTRGSEIPSPRANFGFIRAGDKIFAVGGRSSNFDPFLAHLNPFEVFMLSPKIGLWQKIITTGSEPQHSIGARCAFLSSNELVVVTGLIPMIHNWMQEPIPEGNFEHLRASMQVSVLKFSDSSMEKGSWFRIADWWHSRRGNPPPRAEFHLINLGNDNILMIGGCSTNQIVQDSWLMKITRDPYNVKFTQVAITNPYAPALPLHLFPSCLIGDIFVFTGVRTILKKPGIDKPREEPKKVQESTQSTQPSSSIQFERRTPIFINLERPINTIGAMAAFSVSSQPAVPPQKVLKIQIASPDPSPEPARRRQDFPMRIFCLDLSGIINGTDRPNPTVSWLEMRNGGIFLGAPELRAHGTFTKFENGIALIGGVRRAQTDDDNLFTQATNEVYMLDYVYDQT